MKPIGPLMWEHRLIEQALSAAGPEIERIRERREVNPVFVDVIVDFIRTYADRTHHGKEEEILFRDLAKKPLAAEHKRIMDELVAEHVMSRRTVGRLVEAKERFLQGADTRAEIASGLTTLAEFYPKHIEKEDKHFFFPCMDYFSPAEQAAMLDEFWAFDRTMIHEKYGRIVETLTGRKAILPK
ncbi:MAG TPA: hemerythrin domain-containing protein [Syntrophales bacterium]|nr:hemerythrin domain-containing protein [Syntrophales bacterium]